MWSQLNVSSPYDILLPVQCLDGVNTSSVLDRTVVDDELLDGVLVEGLKAVPDLNDSQR